MKKAALTIMVAFALPFGSFAQDMLGLRQMNYSGVHGVDLNPANVVDSRYKADVSLAGFTFGVYNNYASTNLRLLNDTSRTNDPDFITKYIDWDDGNNDTKSVYLNNEIQLPSFLISFSDKAAGAFTWKLRTMVNVDNISPELALLMREELEYPSLWVTPLDDQSVSIQSQSWAEYGFAYGRVLRDHDEHFIKVGGKLKILQGLQAVYTFVDDLKYSFLNADSANIFQSQVDYGHSDNWEISEDGGGIAGSGISYKFHSRPGIGLDIGAVYEWRPDYKDYKYDMDGQTDLWRRDQNKYKLKVGFAITDIGGIKYDKGEFSRSFFADVDSLLLDTFSVVDDVASLDSAFNALFPELEDERTFKMNLPTAISLTVDYNVWKDFYVNFTPYWALKFTNNEDKVHFYTNYSITPRYDWKWAGVSFPISISNFAGNRIGMGLRAGPIWLGTSSLGSLVSKNDSKRFNGTDFWMAVKVPIMYGKPKDRDLDKVSDKLDECIDVAGVWEFKGCPDTDKDGIRDTEDECPAEAGLLEFKGCPDTDGDGIPDKADDCPTVPGVADFKGCPDTDGDGIKDDEDKCPETPGIIEFEGCPDTDGDGIQDTEDLCPETPGPVENQGCPDTDGDGIFDYLDDCVDVPGPGENKGCPWPDTDGDGLLDKDDKCPNNAGPIENEGCPYSDTDGDGVLDKDDACPNVPGIPENQGCPEIKEEEQEILNTAFENLEFESGKDVIRNSSFVSLVELAELLKKKPDWKLLIAGHTDNVGSERTNLILSKKRSEAVKQFLSDNGVNADNLTVEYYGETKPIADNDTKEGRQKNRRVEMTIEFE